MPRPSLLQITYPCYGIRTAASAVTQPNNVVAVQAGSGTRTGSYSTAPTSSWSSGGNLPANHLGSTAQGLGVCYSNALAMAVVALDGGDAASPSTMGWSTDGGHTWTGAAGVPNEGSWTMADVCWSSDLSLFCAVASAGPTTTQRILTSSDGKNWTARAIPTASKVLRCVAWSHDLLKFVALGDGNYVTYSSDGVTWNDTGVSGLSDSNTWQRIVWCGGTIQKFVAVGRGGATFVACRSSDGLTWTMFDGGTNTWDIAYSPDIGVVAFTRANTPSITHSTDAVSWSTSVPSGSSIFKGICWSHTFSEFVVTSSSQDVVTSGDGSTWTTNTLAELTPSAGNSWFRCTACE